MPDITIQALKNGPLLVKGVFGLTDAQGVDVPVDKDKPTALCRCGHSSKKPFCDGSHRSANFQG